MVYGCIQNFHEINHISNNVKFGVSEHVHFLQDLDGFGMEGMEMENGRMPLEAPWYGYIMLYNYIIYYHIISTFSGSTTGV